MNSRKLLTKNEEEIKNKKLNRFHEPSIYKGSNEGNKACFQLLIIVSPKGDLS